MGKQIFSTTYIFSLQLQFIMLATLHSSLKCTVYLFQYHTPHTERQKKKIRRKKKKKTDVWAEKKEREILLTRWHCESLLLLLVTKTGCQGGQGSPRAVAPSEEE
jgi:hypothetical protein